MNQIGYYNETSESINELSTVKTAVQKAIELEGLKDVEFNIIFVDDNYIKQINKEYRGKDSVTDVISFALEDDNNFPNLETRILGDIYISINRAKEQAINYKHSLSRELSFLAVHGLLHLLGYDHMNEEDEKIMFKRQEMILDAAKITRS